MDSIGPPTRIAAAQGVHSGPTAEQWQRCRPRLVQLYSIEKKTLREVMYTLAREQGLRVTIKQWNLERRNKRQDVLAILRKQHERQGKPIIFLRGGRIVDMDSIDRYAKRNQISDCHRPWLLGDSHDISDEILCITPPTERLSTLALPDVLRIPEVMLHRVNLYMERLFATNAFNNGVPVELGREMSLSRSLYDVISIGCRQHWEGCYSLAWASWRKAFEMVDVVVPDAGYRNMITFVRTSSLLYHAGHTQLAMRLYEYISDLCETRVSPDLPQHTVYTSFKALAVENNLDVNDRIELLCIDLLDSRSVASMYFRFSERKKYARQQLLDNPQSQLEDFLPSLAEFDKCFGISSWQSLQWIHLQSTTSIYRKLYKNARGLAQELTRRLKMAKATEVDHVYFAITASEVIGLSQYYQHDDDNATKSFKACLATIKLYTNVFECGHWVYTTANCLQCLETIAANARKYHEAAEYHGEVLRLIDSDREGVAPTPSVISL